MNRLVELDPSNEAVRPTHCRSQPFHPTEFHKYVVMNSRPLYELNLAAMW
jgi:hypothetical protein